MNAPADTPPRLPAPPTEKTLRKLFLTLFLRGRSSRGLQKQDAPKSVGSKFALALFFYVAMGLFVIGLIHQPVFVISLYLQGMTLVFLGMFVAGSAGEVLFNKEEGEILMHRPVTARQLLWAKISVLVRVSVWLAAAFNLAGFFVGMAAPDGTWLFLVAHAASITLQALFCTGSVVLVYQLCLRWFGRERLDGLMTTAQVFISIAAVVSGQIVPRMIGRIGGTVSPWLTGWWIAVLPPAWFAGFDDALAGSGARKSWIMAALALLSAATVVWLAFGKLAQDYGRGIQTLNEASSKRPRRAGRRWIDTIVTIPPLRWWLRDSVSRASFLLTAAYLVRDRDVKLRVYPGLAPMLVIPFIFLLQGRDRGFGGDFGLAFTGSYLGLIPLMALDMLRYSQQWQAGDVFRAAPMPGPAPLCHGARRAVLLFVALPLLCLFTLIAWLLVRDAAGLLLLLPGAIALPVYSLVPCLGGKAVPLSMPNEEGRSAKRGAKMFGVMFISFGLAGIATWAHSGGWLTGMLLVETFVVVCLYAVLRGSVAAARWQPME
jgi:ABC-2 type transport system permease protein